MYLKIYNHIYIVVIASNRVMSYKEITLDFEQNVTNITFTVNKLLENLFPTTFEQLQKNFNTIYQTRLEFHQKDDFTDYLKLRRLITEFKPSLEYVLEPGPECDQIIDWMTQTFDSILGGAKRQLTGELKRSGIGGITTPTLKYYCTVCKEIFDIPEGKKEQILNSEEIVSLPKHHDQEMQIKIERYESLIDDKPKVQINETDFSVNQLLQVNPIQETPFLPDLITVTSVGIDIGSSTSHLIFSRLVLKREVGFLNMTGRYLLLKREILFESTIINTPLLNETTIDIEAVISFIEHEYETAGITIEEVDTGAVIVTGETAKKNNAEEIVKRISSETGKFVSATAGPNYESILGIMGSGILDKSQSEQKTYLNIDVGGGTSNLAVGSNGLVTSTACINVGGRLLGVEKDLTIWRIDQPSYEIMKFLGMDYAIGDKISLEDITKIVQAYASALLEVMLGPANSELSKLLMMTPGIVFDKKIDAYSFSGGVAEFMYSNEVPEPFTYRDIGILLAQELKKQMNEKKLLIIEPENKIRATVIGAGAFSLSVSGTTCYVDPSVELPINNIPVIPVQVTKESFSIIKTEQSIKQALKSYDIDPSKDIFALYFDEPIYHVSGYLNELAKGLELGLNERVKHDTIESPPVIAIFKTDLAKMLSIHIKKETNLPEKIILLDEIQLTSGDWIDIGESLANRNVFPVTVKSLVFKKQ